MLSGLEVAAVAALVAVIGVALVWSFIGIRYAIDGTTSSCFNGCWFCRVAREMRWLPPPPVGLGRASNAEAHPLLSVAGHDAAADAPDTAR